VQEYNRSAPGFQAGLLFLATVALLIPFGDVERRCATGAASPASR
jgi:hypothetical protein